MNIFIFIQSINKNLEPLFVNEAAGFLTLLNKTLLEYNLEKFTNNESISIVCTKQDETKVRDLCKNYPNASILSNIEIPTNDDSLLVNASQYPSYKTDGLEQNTCFINTHNYTPTISALFLKKEDLKNSHIDAFLHNKIKNIESYSETKTSELKAIQFS